MVSNEARFTNGEWYAHPNGVGCGGIAIVSTPNGCALSKSEDNANADLIAAAPEMYEAMQELVDRVERGEVRSVKTYNKFKAILAKARGEKNAKS